MKIGRLFCVSLFATSLFSCASNNHPQEVATEYKIVLEDNKYIKCDKPILSVHEGEDAIFTLTLEYQAKIDDCSYENYLVEYVSDTEAILTLYNVEYSSFVTVTSSYDSFDENDDFEIDSNVVYRTVTIEENEDIELEKTTYIVEKGDRLIVPLVMKDGAFVLKINYWKSKIIRKTQTTTILVLHNIRKDLNIKITTTKESVKYDPNGGKLRSDEEILSLPISHSHLRINSPIGSDYMYRVGYYQIGWNTKADYSGTFISFGSRFEESITTLYAQWEKVSDIDDFKYTINDDFVTIDEYIGTGRRVCIPSRINRLRVTALGPDSFKNKEIDIVIIPSSIREIPDFAFDGSSVDEIYLSDNLSCISNETFGSATPRTVHVSALNAPINSGTYFDAFQDKIDYLYSIRDEKKIVLFGGSSSRYGYVSPLIMDAFPDYKVVNMGVFAYVSEKVQLDVVRKFMKPGDILLDAPEFDALTCQFFYDNWMEVQHFNMFEANYDTLSLLNMNDYKFSWTNLGVHFADKLAIKGKSYDVQAKRFDDDMNFSEFDTYNIYGDFTLPRPNHPYDEVLCQELCDYTVNPFHHSFIESYNNTYDLLKEEGVAMLFTYAPKNIRCLTPESTNLEIDRLDYFLRQNIKAPIISNIWQSLFEPYYFYLIDNHLSDEGAVMRTNNVINDLKNYFASIA